MSSHRADVPKNLCANPRDPRGLRSDFLLLVLDADGAVACSLGPDLGAAAPSFDGVDLAGTDEILTLPSVDADTRWRVRASYDQLTDQTVVLAVSLADADATVSRLTRLSLLISALVLMCTAVAAWAIARIGLRAAGTDRGDRGADRRRRPQ